MALRGPRDTLNLFESVATKEPRTIYKRGIFLKFAEIFSGEKKMLRGMKKKTRVDRFLLFESALHAELHAHFVIYAFVTLRGLYKGLTHL